MKYFAALALALVLIAPAQAEEDCRLEIVTSMPIQIDPSGRATITAAIGDKPVRLLVDTGAPVSALTQRTAEALGLKILVNRMPISFRMFGGEHLSHLVNVRDFKLGRMTADKAMFLIMSSDRMPEGIDGLIGADFIRNFDVDFDFAGGKINLFRPHRCEGKAVYWTQDQSAIAVIPFHHDVDDNTAIVIPIAIDGKKIDAIVDTGAYGSVMNLEAAHNLFGLDASSPEMRTTASGRYTYPFKTMTFAGVTVSNPKIDMLPRDTSKFTDYRMLLGVSVLRQLHLFVAYDAQVLFVTAASAH